MDNLTHALSGALLAKAVAPAHSRPGSPTHGQRMLASVVATGVVPDLDFVATYISPLSYLFHHRGVTHSLVMLPLWAVLLGALWSWLHARNLRLWRDYAGIFAMGIALHIAGDVITSYGTQVFAPLSSVRYTLSTTFIIDLWLMGLLALGLAIAMRFGRSRLPAVIACMAVVCYIGFQSMLRERALEFGTAYAQREGLADARVRALPSPLSPYNWVVVTQQPAQLRYAYVSLWREQVLPDPGDDAGFFERVGAPYRPLSTAAWESRGLFGNMEDGADRALIEAAWRAPAFAFFRWFADYPMFYRLDREGTHVCAWFEDLRFVTPGRAQVPFRYGLCRDGDGAWQAHRLQGDGSRVPVY
jgi:inner membrane protein